VDPIKNSGKPSFNFGDEPPFSKTATNGQKPAIPAKSAAVATKAKAKTSPSPSPPPPPLLKKTTTPKPEAKEEFLVMADGELRATKGETRGKRRPGDMPPKERSQEDIRREFEEKLAAGRAGLRPAPPPLPPAPLGVVVDLSDVRKRRAGSGGSADGETDSGISLANGHTSAAISPPPPPPPPVAPSPPPPPPPPQFMEPQVSTRAYEPRHAAPK